MMGMKKIWAFAVLTSLFFSLEMGALAQEYPPVHSGLKPYVAVAERYKQEDVGNRVEERESCECCILEGYPAHHIPMRMPLEFAPRDCRDKHYQQYPEDPQ